MPPITVEAAAIPGLLVVRLDVREDGRGWFKENWQREKMRALGLPDFGPVQHNVALNSLRGTTRGVHAEPWDKLVSVAAGRAYGVWVDLRAGEAFGTVVELDLDPSVAVFVPRGVGNAYQTLEDATSYSYLVNHHWSAGATYVGVDLADPDLGIRWPIPLADAVMSTKDQTSQRLTAVTPFPPQRPVILGADGQLGRALLAEFPDAVATSRSDLDLTDRAALEAWPWRDHGVVLNAAAFTDVDGAEGPEGRRTAWRVNAVGPADLARLAAAHGCVMVHYSSDYVFDGGEAAHHEDEPPSPLGVYGQSKAAGDQAVSLTPRHYLLRTSWVVGRGRSFVATMRSLAESGARPSVVDDQIGRLTFTSELARATRHLLESSAPYGTYHVSNGGPPMSWADVAAEVFHLSGRDPADVVRVSSAVYSAERASAPRPANSVLDLAKVRSTGFEPRDARAELRRHLLAE